MDWRQRLKEHQDRKFADKYIMEHEGASTERLFRDLNQHRGIKISKRSIEHFKDSLQDYIQKHSRNSLNRKVVFPYLGGWFFDLLINRSISGHEYQSTTVPFWAAFCHGNSGYMVIFPCHFKTGPNLNKIADAFYHFCKRLPVIAHNNFSQVSYPVKVIVSDMEPGWNPKLPGVKIVKYNAGENHRIHSRINAFMSQCRRWKAMEPRSTGDKSEFISNDDMEMFVNNWNSQYLSFAGCTRGEMLTNKDLELAYIAKALYVNEGKAKEAADLFEDDDLLSIRQTKKTFGNTATPVGQVLPGKYRIVDHAGAGLTVENIYNKTDRRNIHYNDISTIHKGSLQQRKYWEKELQGVKDPLEDLFGLNFIHIKEEVPKEKLKKLRFGNSERLTNQIYTDIQQNWEKYGFASEWRPEEVYQKLEMIQQKLKDSMDKYNYIVGDNRIPKGHITKEVARGIQKRAREILARGYWTYDPGKTDAVENFDYILKKRQYEQMRKKT